MAEAENQEQVVEEERVVPVRLVGLDEEPARFANIVQVNSDPTTIQVLFAQWLQPALASPDQARHITERGYAIAHVQARLVLTPRMVEETIEVLTKQLEQFRSQAAQPPGGGVEADNA